MADELLASALAADTCDPVLTLSQWATALEVSEQTVRTWIKTRRLIAYRLASGPYIIVRTSLRGLVPPDAEELARRKLLARIAAEQEPSPR